ncbi:MAG: hypothetical protein HRT35_22920 [Algicola sp.]|nr:hypothetical protein [Algicola sp.]
MDEGIELESIIAEELVLHKTIYGYGRPLASTDERVPHMLKFAQDNGMKDGKHLKIALQAARILKRDKGLSMNIAGPNCALAADMGFTVEQYHMFMTPVFLAGMTPCLIEARENPAGTFVPIRCDRIEYTGEKDRRW